MRELREGRGIEGGHGSTLLAASDTVGRGPHCAHSERGRGPQGEKVR